MKVVIIGAGAAGMMAAIAAAEHADEVCVLEKNERLGKKLYITGKGRCNLTNACDTEDLFENILTNRKFLYSAIYSFDNKMVCDFFEGEGIRLKTERGGRVFPLSDHSYDIIDALSGAMKSKNVEIKLNTTVTGICVKDGTVTGVMTKTEKISCDKVIVATGGLSYPSTGSTGDGMFFAKELGHSIKECRPSLCPFNCEEKWVKDLSGLALKNVGIRIELSGRKQYEDFGEMLFTHFGVSGPVILTASASKPGDEISAHPLSLYIDLKPALSEDELDARILRDFEEEKNKNFNNSLNKLLPKSLISVIIDKSGIDPYKKVNEITKEERRNLTLAIKNLKLTLTSLRDYNEAIITKGGVNVKEINPQTMESKLVSGLYFAGEVLDLDAKTGGFNLQIAWSTGHLAGMSLDFTGGI